MFVFYCLFKKINLNESHLKLVKTTYWLLVFFKGFWVKQVCELSLLFSAVFYMNNVLFFLSTFSIENCIEKDVFHIEICFEKTFFL